MGSPPRLDQFRKTYEFFDKEGVRVLWPRRSYIEDDKYVNLDLTSKEFDRPGHPSEAAIAINDDLHRAIRSSDFVYIANTFNSFDDIQNFAAGYAHALGKSVFSSERIENPPAGAYVTICSPQEAIEFLKARGLFNA